MLVPPTPPPITTACACSTMPERDPPAVVGGARGRRYGGAKLRMRERPAGGGLDRGQEVGDDALQHGSVASHDGPQAAAGLGIAVADHRPTAPVSVEPAAPPLVAGVAVGDGPAGGHPPPGRARG